MCICAPCWYGFCLFLSADLFRAHSLSLKYEIYEICSCLKCYPACPYVLLFLRTRAPAHAHAHTRVHLLATDRFPRRSLQLREDGRVLGIPPRAPHPEISSRHYLEPRSTAGGGGFKYEQARALSPSSARSSEPRTLPA